MPTYSKMILARRTNKQKKAGGRHPPSIETDLTRPVLLYMEETATNQIITSLDNYRALGKMHLAC
jgi:hypothetical protein